MNALEDLIFWEKSQNKTIHTFRRLAYNRSARGQGTKSPPKFDIYSSRPKEKKLNSTSYKFKNYNL